MSKLDFIPSDGFKNPFIRCHLQPIFIAFSQLGPTNFFRSISSITRVCLRGSIVIITHILTVTLILVFLAAKLLAAATWLEAAMGLASQAVGVPALVVPFMGEAPAGNGAMCSLRSELSVLFL